MLLVSLVLGGLIFYGFYTASDNTFYSIVSAVFGFILLASSMAFHRPKAARSSAMVKVLSGIFFVLVLAMNILLVYFTVSKPVFIISNGVALCLWASLAYFVGRTRQ